MAAASGISAQGAPSPEAYALCPFRLCIHIAEATGGFVPSHNDASGLGRPKQQSFPETLNDA